MSDDRVSSLGRRLRRGAGRVRRFLQPGPAARPTEARVTTAATGPLSKADPEIIKLLTDMRWELREQRKYLEMFRHQVARPVLSQVELFVSEHQLNFEQTLLSLSQERRSLARFGDGELNSMLRPTFNLRFQPSSLGLARDLRAVLTYDGYDPAQLLVGFPHAYRNLHWSGVWLDIWDDVLPLVDLEARVYGNSHVSRPICFQQLGEQAVQMWRDVWDGQRICVVTGRGSRFELIPELFDNITAVRSVWSTPLDAYADLPRLREQLLREDPDQLFLVALGPAGTLISAWLSTQNRWAIDVGHLSDSWVNVFAGGMWPESLGVLKPVPASGL